MTEEERIFKGELFASEVPELVAKKLKAHRLSQEYSDLFEEDTAERERILHDLLAIVGEGTCMTCWPSWAKAPSCWGPSASTTAVTPG